MSPAASAVQLHRLIAERIDERADGFMQKITADQREVPDSDSAEFAALCLDLKDAAEIWRAAMVDDCIHLLREHNRLEAPNLWQSLFAISKGIIAPHLQKLLRAAFRMTQRDFDLIERWQDFAREVEVGTWELDADTKRDLDNACDRTTAVNKIIDKLLGSVRDWKGDFSTDPELAFGTQAEPKFDVPSAQINAAKTWDAQPGGPALPHIPEARTHRNESGRPQHLLPSGFSVSDDYRSVTYDGNQYTLTRRQSIMLKMLHEAHKSGYPDVDKDRLLAATEAETSRVRDTWKKSGLWRTLIITERKGIYRLNIPKPE